MQSINGRFPVCVVWEDFEKVIVRREQDVAVARHSICGT